MNHRDAVKPLSLWYLWAPLVQKHFSQTEAGLACFQATNLSDFMEHVQYIFFLLFFIFISEGRDDQMRLACMLVSVIIACSLCNYSMYNINWLWKRETLNHANPEECSRLTDLEIIIRMSHKSSD